jgi:hypothetical protein
MPQVLYLHQLATLVLSTAPPQSTTMASTPTPPNASAALAAIIEEELPVINLTTPMTLAPNTKFLITCSSDIKLANEYLPNLPIYVSATIPTTITTTCRMLIEPSGDLGEKFVQGWRALPEELRLRVLHFNLLSPNVHIDSLHPQQVGGSRDDHQETLLRFLSMGPEIASVAPEAYYKANKFLIFHASCGAGPFLPLPSIRPWITQIIVNISLSQAEWAIIQRFAWDGYGLENLRHVQVGVYLMQEDIKFINRHLDKIVLDPDACQIWFRCSGLLDFNKNMCSYGLRHQLAKINYTMEGVEERLRKAIHFTT